MQPFTIVDHNSHYDAGYDARRIAWGRVMAVDKVNNMQALLNKQRHTIDTVLEVGCGHGVVLAEVVKRGIGKKHYGVDVQPLGELQRAALPSATFATYDGERLPFDDKSIDFVYSTHVVEHVLHPRKYLAELARVAKHLLYLEVPCELHFFTNRGSLQMTLGIGHINCYTPDSFLILLQTSGLNVIDLEVFDHILEAQTFWNGRIKGMAKMAIRSSILKLSPKLASKLFTYHCGALIAMES